MSRPEAEIWKDLERLCVSSGYVHTFAKLWWDARTDRGKLSNNDLLTVSELALLIGLMVKENINTSETTLETHKHYETLTKRFLKELQYAILSPEIGASLKEASFYSGRTTLDFQYLDFSLQKYKKDEKWLLENKGFTIENAIDVVKSIWEIFSKKKLSLLYFNLTELMDNTGIAEDVIRNVISNFSIEPRPGCNQEFKQVGDRSKADSHPIISSGKDEYLLLESANLCKSIYQSPAFWMAKDEKYKNAASINRGEFVETFIADKLKPIFGEENVHKNVKIKNGKRSAGEIDILVLYANKAIIVQAKSKSLTTDSRKGDAASLEQDFEKSIQAAYAQGVSCASHLLSPNSCKFLIEYGNELNISKNIQDIFILCVVADDYSGLPMHVNQFFRYDPKYPPYIADIFILDLIVTFLGEPLYFLDFIYKRTKGFQQINPLFGSEFDILSYYLRNGLSEAKEEEYDSFVIENDPTGLLDDIMIAKHIEPSKTIKAIMAELKFEGMRTLFFDTFLEKTIDYINKTEDSLALDFGLFLLSLDKASINSISDNIAVAMKNSVSNKKNYTLSSACKNTGFAAFCNHTLPNKDYIYHYCSQAKYIYKLDKWFGCVLDDNILKPVLKLDFPFLQCDEMDKQIQQVKLINPSSTDISK